MLKLKAMGTYQFVSNVRTVKTSNDGGNVNLNVGDPVFRDTIETIGSGAGPFFLDNNIIIEGGKMVLDELVYDPATVPTIWQLICSKERLVFSGEIAKTGLTP